MAHLPNTSTSRLETTRRRRWTAAAALSVLFVYSCSGSTDKERDAGPDALPSHDVTDAGPDALPSHCCPLDYYLCDGGSRGGRRPADGICPRVADSSFSPRVETVDEYGCPVIDLAKSKEVSCFPFLPDADAGGDASTGGDSAALDAGDGGA